MWCVKYGICVCGYVIFIYLIYLFLSVPKSGLWERDVGVCIPYSSFSLSLSLPQSRVLFPYFLCFACLPHLLLKYQFRKLRNFEQFFYNKLAYLQNSPAECWKPNDTLVFHYVFLSNRCPSPCWWKDASYGHMLIKTTEKVYQHFSKFYFLYNYDPDLQGLLLHYYCGFLFQ